ncbi:MAG TPA: lysylphosphatidylglycerol synthase transmembrane domain-containing protein [Bryobacteraceae bacterium]|jgi:hypothetical protein|nr:lysylphosphatidylglycerol synthase transmembrane domain-containing protein [Bryobacteraceae bacterium]
MGIVTSFYTRKPQKPKRRKHRTATILAIALVVAFGWFAWDHYSSFAWSRFFESFGLINRYWFMGGILFAFASFTVRAVRWQVLMLPARSSFKAVWQATLVGCAACVILGRAGELVRPYLISRRERTAFSLQAGVWVLERLYDLLAILALFGIGLSRARKLGVGPDSPLAMVLRVGGWIVIVGAVVTAALLVLVGPHADSLSNRLSRWLSFLPKARAEAILNAVGSFLSGLKIEGKTSIVLLTVFWSVIEWLLILGAYWCYFRGFPPTSAYSVSDIAGFIGFIGLGGIVQLPGIGGGMQIASVVILTELFRISVEVATGFTLLLWVGTTLVPLPFGVVLGLIQGLNLKKLRNLGEEPTL